MCVRACVRACVCGVKFDWKSATGYRNFYGTPCRAMIVEHDIDIERKWYLRQTHFLITFEFYRTFHFRRESYHTVLVAVHREHFENVT